MKSRKIGYTLNKSRKISSVYLKDNKRIYRNGRKVKKSQKIYKKKSTIPKKKSRKLRKTSRTCAKQWCRGYYTKKDCEDKHHKFITKSRKIGSCKWKNKKCGVSMKFKMGNEEDYNKLTRSELQKIAKENGIKANLKSSVIIDQLLAIEDVNRLNLKKGEVLRSNHKQCEKFVILKEDGSEFEGYTLIQFPQGKSESDILFGKNIVNTDFIKEPDGYYTWIFGKDSDNNKRFEATRVISPSELGTGHPQIIIRSDKIDTIEFAGEIHKIGEKIQFNLYSGSTGMMYLEDQSKIGKYLCKQFQQLFKDQQIEFVDHAFDLRNIKMTSQMIQEYKQILDKIWKGYIPTKLEQSIRFYETKKKCLSVKDRSIEIVKQQARIKIVKNQLDDAIKKNRPSKMIEKTKTRLKQLKEELEELQNLDNLPKEKKLFQFK